MFCYVNGRFVAAADASISVLDRGFIFGDGVYEVWRVVQGQLFAAQRHQARLERGLSELRIAPPPQATLAGILEIAIRLFAENGLVGRDATLYVEITRGSAPRTHSFPPANSPATMLVMASPFAPSDARFSGTSVITQPDIRWLRCDIKTIQLLPNVLARQAATEAGASEAIFVRDGLITEGTHTTVCAMIDGELRTHPANHLVLPGVTREIVLDLARAQGLPVREEAISIAELPYADELFLTGTTTDVTPIVAVDGRAVAGGAPGPMARMLLDHLLKVMSREARISESASTPASRGAPQPLAAE